jgi:23S rRNA pseudouridine2605 synthase/16S rRNA pseudouridine516 synthase
MAQRLERGLKRLHVVIARAGVCSRREAEKRISEGRVSVNGELVRQLGTKVDSARDDIRVDNRVISRPEEAVTVMLNKPKGVVTTSHDPRHRRTVIDLVADVKQRLFPVGRLDYHTEGLLLLTTDGRLSHLLQHPRHGVEKTYQAKVKGIPKKEALERLRRGVVLDGRMTAPAQVRQLECTDSNAWLEITIKEGRNRQVRRMCGKVGHPVTKLKRTRYGPLSVEHLKPGSYRRLSDTEINRLYRYARNEQKP